MTTTKTALRCCALLSAALFSAAALAQQVIEPAPAQVPAQATPPSAESNQAAVAADTTPATTTQSSEAAPDEASQTDAQQTDTQQADPTPAPDQITPPPQPAPVAIEPSPEQRARAELDRMDHDGDGRISRHDYITDAKTRFDAIDSDRNFHISATEMADFRNAGKPIAEQISDTDAIKSIDTNNNGEVTVAEYERTADEEFRMRDSNRDGFLDENELKSSSSSMENTDPSNSP